MGHYGKNSLKFESF